MITEAFIQADPATIEKTDADQERFAQLSKLGFTQLLSAEYRQNNNSDVANTLYPKLEGKTLRTWKRFLPTPYEIRHYTHDSVPTEALSHIATAQELNCFDRIEIWTPEGNSFLGLVACKANVAQNMLKDLMSKLDPMAVGIIRDVKGNEHYYQIVRWGEALLPFKEIQSHTRKVHGMAKLLFGVLPALLVMAGIAAFYNGIVIYGYGNMFGFVGLSLVALFVVAVLGSLTWDSFR